MERMLCRLLHKQKFIEFSAQELISLSALRGVSVRELLPEMEGSYSSDYDLAEAAANKVKKSPILKVQLPLAVAQYVVSRSVCVEKFVRLIGEGSTLEDLLEDCLRRVSDDAEVRNMIAQETTFAFEIDVIYGKIDKPEQREIIDRFAVLPFAGKVAMKEPERKFVVIRDLRALDKWYFGLQVAHTREGSKRWYNRYMLTKREYLGPTSTDTELAILMVNQAQVVPGSIILDPFCGTGSILVAAAHFKALCFGCDIDMRVLRGWSVGRSTSDSPGNIFTNFDVYGLEYPEIIRNDVSLNIWRQEGLFDAVICDPPYGIRAGSRKKTTRSENSTETYESRNAILDLLDFSAKVLRVGGRLVYLLPTDRDVYDIRDIPVHPDLRLVANSENLLSSRISRRLITLEKIGGEGGVTQGGEFLTSVKDKYYDRK
mmetsp:Transcript_4706/g.8847  ORF Transcript_4706/g.8847 Transcript_4706/m.8847 type:complete len:429 (-) Transcript_4706:212-1498(-)|eukprot:CAMPEP_0204916830 /NCGR_PEP_ID=MMETSP1397-20131031/14557_1 /ASSEMBLY_ACC=CAM_ASM_000891 /TAXON_ID=49980 /ORGANISM="Climacostomum Climacostomum virens, Strain Stock W-24" /LENGTH=428 /DNA_ID=CAMNT_0052089493 /DNA_START=83 /DNA_END=1369 /DNA_ORIENTATION=-